MTKEPTNKNACGLGRQPANYDYSDKEESGNLTRGGLMSLAEDLKRYSLSKEEPINHSKIGGLNCARQHYYDGLGGLSNMVDSVNPPSLGQKSGVNKDEPKVGLNPSHKPQQGLGLMDYLNRE